MEKLVGNNKLHGGEKKQPDKQHGEKDPEWTTGTAETVRDRATKVAVPYLL